MGENIFAGHSGPSLSPRLNTLLYNWGFNFVYEMHHPRTINFSDSFQALVASLEHPLRTIFKGYTPKDEQAWNNLWTLMRSTTMTNFNQGCALIEGFVEGDQDLRNALIANYEASPLDAQLSFYCNSWWMLLFMEATEEESEPDQGFDVLQDFWTRSAALDLSLTSVTALQPFLKTDESSVQMATSCHDLKLSR